MCVIFLVATIKASIEADVLCEVFELLLEALKHAREILKKQYLSPIVFDG